MAESDEAHEFLRRVHRSGLLTERFIQLERPDRGLDAEPLSPVELAAMLVRSGFLTRFQADHLLEGHWRHFQIGKYTVLDQLGFGRSTTYLCECRYNSPPRRYVLKLLPALPSDDYRRQRFEIQARAVAALNHPNIVRLYDLNEDAGVSFLLLEYVRGVNLQQLAACSGPLSPEQASRYVWQAAQGMQSAHEHDLHHQLLRPDNFLLDCAGTLKINNLALAPYLEGVEEFDWPLRLIDESSPPDPKGLVDYLSPEQCLDGGSVDSRSEVYSLGCIFYFLLAGQPPFPEGSVAQMLIWHQTREPQSLAQLRPDVPSEFIAIVEKMMRKRREDRYQSMREVAVAIEALPGWTAVHPSAELETNWPPVIVELAQSLLDGLPCQFALHDALLDHGQALLAEHFRQPEHTHGRTCWGLKVILGLP